jgi:thymidylate synthase (FAD)
MTDDWDRECLAREERRNRATAFLVECPLYIRSQWMRHRSFSYLEMSRRYTKGSKVQWKYYGDEYLQESGCPEQMKDPMDLRAVVNFWEACEHEYQRRLDAGWPNEIARGCMPMEAMTRFWVAGFDRDWEAFLKLRDDPHAQPEIRVFAQWIRNRLHPESVSIDAGNLGT